MADDSDNPRRRTAQGERIARTARDFAHGKEGHQIVQLVRDRLQGREKMLGQLTLFAVG